MGCCFAREFSSSEYRLHSSFRVQDALLEKKSRYFGEAERLSALIRLVKKEKSLPLIDEILSGTNAEEKIYASVRILEYFARFNNSIIISATHDLEIAEQLKDHYHLADFEGTVDGKNIVYDYQLKDGIVSNRNGILILKALRMDIL